jgi:ABC-2 type transport system permease protein
MPIAEAAPASGTTARAQRLPRVSAGPGLALVRRRLLDLRIVTVAFAYLFAIYSYIQPSGYRSAYPKLSDRLVFAHSFAANKGLRLLYGLPHDVATVSGYAAWRVGGVLALAAALYGLLAAVRVTRSEEESGRLELVLAATVARRTASLAAAAALAGGTVILWVAEVVGLVVGGLPLAGSAYLALATASIVPVCAAIAALAAQLAPTRRIALELAGSTIGLLFLFRVLADTVNGLSWLRWATPLGWAEELRPFADPQPLVLFVPIATTALIFALAAALADRRDIGTGVLPSRDSAEPRTRLLRSTTGQALRSQQGALIAWTGCVAAFSFILGTVAKSISPADVSTSVRHSIAKLGSGSIATPTGYLAFVFIFLVLAVSVFVCTQIGAARQEELDQRLETIVALPVGRPRWLAGRIALAAVAAAGISVIAGLLAWAGASAGGAHVSLPRMIEAGANALPTALLFLGIAALAYAAAPRASAAITYALITVSFLWQLVGSLLAAPRWLLDLTLFAHVAAVPTQPFRTLAAAIMITIGIATALAATQLLRRRDLTGT